MIGDGVFGTECVYCDGEDEEDEEVVEEDEEVVEEEDEDENEEDEEDEE